jgi:hypothetical protein
LRMQHMHEQRHRTKEYRSLHRAAVFK